MQISPIASNRLSFGMISQDAIDAIRKNAEGYEISGNYGKCELSNEIRESYTINPKFSRFTKEQLSRLKSIVKRASLLRKTVIGSSVEEDFKYTYRTKNGIKVFTKDRSLDMDFPLDEIKGENDKILDIVEGAVSYAEDIEQNSKVKPYERLNCDIEGYGSVFYAPARAKDNQRSKEENDTMQYIYDLSLNVCKDRFYGNYF